MADSMYAEGGEVQGPRRIGGPLPAGWTLPRFERIGIGADGMCIYARVHDSDGDDDQRE
jgi:hypothetical protein